MHSSSCRDPRWGYESPRPINSWVSLDDSDPQINHDHPSTPNSCRVDLCESTPSGHVDSWISCCVACFYEEGDGVPVLVQHAVISGPITKSTAVHPSIHPFHPFIRAYPLAHARPICSDASRVPLRRSTELVPRPHDEGDAPARGGDAPHSPAARAARRASTLLSSHLAHSLVYLSRPLSSLSPRSLFPSSQGRARARVCVCVCVCV